MSSRRPRKPRPDRFRRFKLAAIPALLAVLGWVVIDNFAGESAIPLPPPLSKLATEPSVPDAVTKKSVPRGWPEVGPELLNKLNPFADYRYVSPTPPAAEVESQLVAKPVAPTESYSTRLQRQLEGQPVHYVFESGARKVVLVGDALIEKGAELHPHVRVKDVRRGRLVLTVRDPGATR